MRETLLFLDDQAIIHKIENDLQRLSYKICKECNFKNFTVNIMELKGKEHIR